MPYEILRPRVTPEDFRGISVPDLRVYFDWVLSVCRERVKTLESAVQESIAFRDWRADLTPNSLRDLGTWFEGEVETRARTPEELRELRVKSLPGISIGERELTRRTFSLAFDMGLYLAQTLQHAYPNLHWQQSLEDKMSVDYGQPVLVGFGRVPLNPIRLVITLAYSIASGQHRGERLQELYSYWAERAAKFAFQRSVTQR